MEVKLLNATPLSVADIAICKCYSNTPNEDIEKQKSRINKVANVQKHASTIEHIVFSFDIDGISRAVLQELCRHRVSSYTVKSSRYTLDELKNEIDFIEEDDKNNTRARKYIVFTGDKLVDTHNIYCLNELRVLVLNRKNDVAKYGMIEAYKTSLVMSINARSLQNFLELRTSKHALWEIQLLAKAMLEAVPETHKFLFEDCLNG